MRNASIHEVDELLLRVARETVEGHRRACSHLGEQASADASTAGRLLLAGRRVFARKGPGGTVREICAEAGANVAAVNYHFGSKDGLLAEVLRTLLDELLEIFPLDGGVPPAAPVEARLHGFVLAFMFRVMLPVCCEDECLLGRILSDAFVRPMPSFERHALRHRRSVRAHLLPLLREIAVSAGGGDEDAIQMMLRSVVAQILFYNTNRDVLMAMRGGAPFAPEEIVDVARCITRFSLGGIRLVSEMKP